jgi:hypothetical protein
MPCGIEFLDFFFVTGKLGAIGEHQVTRANFAQSRLLFGVIVGFGGVVDQTAAVLFAEGIRFRDGRKKGPSIRMQRVLEEFVARGKLDDVAIIHDGDAIAEIFDDRKVMSDEEHGETHLFLEVIEQVDDLSPNRDVEGADRFVANEELRIHDESSGDADALTLTTAEFVGVTGGVFGNKADFLEDFHAFLVVFFFVVLALDVKAFLNDVFDGHAGVEGIDGVLENHLDLIEQPVARGLDLEQIGGGGKRIFNPDLAAVLVIVFDLLDFLFFLEDMELFLFAQSLDFRGVARPDDGVGFLSLGKGRFFFVFERFDLGFVSGLDRGDQGFVIVIGRIVFLG